MFWQQIHDLLEKSTKQQTRDHVIVTGGKPEHIQEEMLYRRSMVRWMERSALYLLSVEQAEVFKDQKFVPAEFPIMPFPFLFIEFNGWLRFHYNEPLAVWNGAALRNPDIAASRFGGFAEYSQQSVKLQASTKDPAYRGVLLVGMCNENHEDHQIRAIWFQQPEYTTVNLDGSIYLTETFDDYVVTVSPLTWPNVYDENQHAMAGETNLKHAKRVFRMTVNLLYFLACENVSLVKITKELHEKRGKELKGLPKPVKPYYTVPMMLPRYRAEHAKPTGNGTHHRYSYDVRGHFRHLSAERFERNEDGSARIIWIHPHRRGVDSDVYVPSVRRGKVGASILEYDEFLRELSRTPARKG